MRLTLKFTLTFVLGLIAVLVVNAYARVRRETAVFRADMQRDNLLIGNVFAAALGRTWQASSLEEALELLRGANQSRDSHVRLRWTWLDAGPDSPDRPRLPREEQEALGRGQVVTYTEHPRRGYGGFLTYVPIVSATGRPAALELAESLDEQQQYVRQTILRTAATTVAMLVVLSLLAVLLGVRFVARPIQQLIGCTQRIAAGDLSGTVELRQRDEFGQLGQAINAMCRDLGVAQARLAAETSARLVALEQLRHADRLQTVGQLTAGVAHELGTPLNVVWARAKMIAQGEVLGEEARGCAQVIVEQAQRMTGIIRKLLDFARPRSPKKTRADLRQVIRQTFELLGSVARKRSVVLVREGGDRPVPVDVDVDQLQQVLSNLVMNAIQAMPQGGQVTVGLRSQRVRPPADHGGPEDDYLCLSVQDQGVGIAEADLTRLFEPFFTTKDVGEGTGLGLSVSRGIIQEHGGWISVESRPGEGACFSVFLPQGPHRCADVS
jgi:signal transduction histidine kinase